MADRIAHACFLAGERGCWGLRAIYLTQDDHQLLKHELGIRLWADIQSYRGTPIRRGKKSMLYSVHGVAVSVPRRVPHT